MSRALYLLFAAVCCGSILSAQHADLSQIENLDLSNYRARYERRPLWTINGGLDHVPERLFSSTSTRLSIASNTDRAISNYSVRLSPSFFWASGSTPDNLNLHKQLEYNKQCESRAKTRRSQFC